MTNWTQWLTAGVLAACLLSLVFSSLGADAILVSGVCVLLVFGVIPAKLAVEGFSNTGMLTVAALFIVAAGIRNTGATSQIMGLLLGNETRPRTLLARLTLPLAAFSGFLNNTTLVAALLPGLVDWARRNRQPPSLILLPLSYATILGGTLTLIGTSTNLVVTGLVEQNAKEVPGLVELGIFDIFPIGLGAALLGCTMLIFLGPLLLPKREMALDRKADPRLYTSEYLVQQGGALVGKSIERAGLRHLPGAFLAELERGGDLVPSVDPQTVLRAGDRLIFVGPKEAMVDLQRIDGLLAASDQYFKLDAPPHERCLVDAVVAPGNPACGKSIRESQFRTQFQAIVVAVAREGERLRGKIGDIVVEPGDVLLLDCSPQWVRKQQDRREFYLVTEVPDSNKYRFNRASISLLILVGLIVVAALDLVSMFVASAGAAALMVLSGCLSGADARRSVDLPVLVAIAAAFGLGSAVHHVGLDQAFAEAVMHWGGHHPGRALVSLYIATAVLTELITNNAAAALMFPFALSLAGTLGVSPMPFVIAVMFAASASFSTPMGYQTNLMVYGPGGYKFSDFLRLGIPLQVGCALSTCYLIPRFFPF